MSLQDLVKSGVDLSNPAATEAAIEKLEVAKGAVADQEAATAQANDEPEQELDEAEQVEPAGDRLVYVEPTGDAEAPDAEDTPSPDETTDAVDETSTVPANAEQIAALEAQLAKLRKDNEELTGVKEKSAASVKRQARFDKLLAELGEDHPLVEIERDRLEEANANELKAAKNDEVVTSAAQQAAHAKHIQTVPLLKSFLEGADKRRVAMALAISTDILDDPKFAGKPAGTEFTAEHYKAVEEELGRQFPSEKAKFYKQAAPAKGNPKVVTLRDVKGGTPPVPGRKPAAGLKDVMSLAMADPNVPLDNILQKLNAG